MIHPLDLVLLQLQRSRGETGDRVDPRVHGSIGLDEEVGRDRSKAEGRNGPNAHRQAQLQVWLQALPHRRASLADGLGLQVFNGRTEPSESAAGDPRAMS